MKKFSIWIAVLSFAVAGWAQEASSQKPMQAMAWMVGGTWTAQPSKDVTIRTQYAWSDNDAFLRFKTHFVTPKGEARRYDGQFYWDREAKQMKMWYMDAENAIYAGPISITPEMTTFDFRGEDFEGKMSDLRVNVTKKSNDQYHWQLLEKSGENWKEIAALDYNRTAS
jgi:hypothetical protein